MQFQSKYYQLVTLKNIIEEKLIIRQNKCIIKKCMMSKILVNNMNLEYESIYPTNEQEFQIMKNGCCLEQFLDMYDDLEEYYLLHLDIHLSLLKIQKILKVNPKAFYQMEKKWMTSLKIITQQFMQMLIELATRFFNKNFNSECNKIIYYKWIKNIKVNLNALNRRSQESILISKFKFTRKQHRIYNPKINKIRSNV
ncbi:hypothetical protein ABPG74_015661 [Tetrahymena malaccensis]